MSRRRPLVEAPVSAASEVLLMQGSPEALRAAVLREAEVTDATSPTEVLGARVEAELDRCAGLLFTATPREDLLEVARWQRLADEAWAGQVRHVVAATVRMSAEERDFAGDEMALALGITPLAGRELVWTCHRVASLPGLVEAVEAGRLGQGHVRVCLKVLREHGGALTQEQQQAVVLIALARFTDQTPGAWGRLVQRLVMSLDVRGAQERKDEASAERRVSFYPLPSEQGGMTLQGPLEQVAAVQARIDAEAARLKAAGDERTLEQLRCDVSLQLLTHGVLDGERPASWSVAVVVPLSTVEGGDREVAEIPGWGPVLPRTGRELAQQAGSSTQVAVEEDGQVLAVSDPRPVPPVAGSALATAARTPPVVRELGSASYRVAPRLRRFLEARDRTCVFPGCTTPAASTDKDHARPWPLGPTDPANVHCLCRRHHRAKQSSSFTVFRLTDGSTLWVTRGQWWFRRRPEGY
ncbi:MAG: DUF222 domain-containing protein [Mycobacteriales bacterium]